jgi:hypothetical protein
VLCRWDGKQDIREIKDFRFEVQRTAELDGGARNRVVPNNGNGMLFIKKRENGKGVYIQASEEITANNFDCKSDCQQLTNNTIAFSY